MKKLYKYSKLFYCIMLLVVSQLAFGQKNKFPYFNTGQTSEGFKILGESTKDKPSPGLITFTKDGIKLIDNYEQYAGVALDNLEFTTEKGFILEFEFGLDSGSAQPRYGDGIAMVLYDGSEANPTMGAKGGALGYAPRKHLTSSNSKLGFSKGFLGLGLDLYGNYKNIMKNKDEIRNGLMTDDAKGNYVVLRGPYSPTSQYDGYPALFAINTVENKNYFLNRTTGAVEIKSRGFEGQRFDIRSGKANVSIGDVGYRKIVISLVPGIDDVNSENGFFISVDVLHGDFKSTVVKNYFIPKAGKIDYIEQVTDKNSERRSLDILVPQSLKMAFTGSTGAASIRAHIRNIALSLPFSPVANDMTYHGVLPDIQNVFKPLYSAFGYNSNVYSVLNPPIKSVLYLDKSSFRFKKMDPVTKQVVLTPNPYELNEPGVGTFTYDKDSGEVSFVPEEGFAGDAPYVFYYDIKNSKPATGVDISIEEYRSRTAAITLNFVKKGTGVDLYPSLIINKGIKKIN
ncbi:lectin-like domain-containing protein [Myroides sp. LoEW2-1]|uniref:lectin-like domain-containing protein n=1 Tax=Myroides sp. LoEW2-1 TaxID=2683192 RepID=UPI001FB74C6F|nr:hypothetical protein [Myroides sp. LoEW2-1]